MESRLQKSFRNVMTGLGSKIAIFLFAFGVRTVFVRTLGAEYNGINGLFNNILSVVCLADLGIANVLNFALYKPIKEENREDIIRLIASFQKIYHGFAAFILFAGLIIMTLLRYIVHSDLPMNDVMIYYSLYLINSIATYLFVYKTTMIAADQNQYISNIIMTMMKILMYVLQILMLVLFHSFTGYLLVQVFCTLTQNCILNYVTVRKYPYLKKIERKNRKPLEKSIYKNIKATLAYRASTVAINNTDNIIISMIFGTVYAGFYSNYYMLVQYVEGVIYTAGTGVLASLGNLNVEMDREKSYDNFRTLNFLYSVIGNIYICCFVNCIQQFIPLWVGEEYLLTNAFAFIMVFQFYFTIIMYPVSMFRETMGIFDEVKCSMAVAAVLNIILSFVLGKICGLFGVVLATIISKLITQFWYEPMILYKKFRKNVLGYFGRCVKYSAVTGVSLALSVMVCGKMPQSFGWILIRAVLCAGLCLLVECLFNYRSYEWKDLGGKISMVLSGRMGRKIS